MQRFPEAYDTYTAGGFDEHYAGYGIEGAKGYPGYENFDEVQRYEYDRTAAPPAKRGANDYRGVAPNRLGGTYEEMMTRDQEKRAFNEDEYYSGYGYDRGENSRKRQNPYEDYYESATGRAQQFYGQGYEPPRRPPPVDDRRWGSNASGRGTKFSSQGGRGSGGRPYTLRPPNPKRSLHKVLNVPADKVIVVEAKAVNAQTTHYYNPVTSTVVPKLPDSPTNIHHMTQLELQTLLDQHQPATIPIKVRGRGGYDRLTERSLNNYLKGYFGPAHFIKIAPEGALHPAHAFVRMETLSGQRKLLAHKGTHRVDGLTLTFIAPTQRLFVARVPEEMSSSELLRYFADEARQYNPDAYVVDVYRPIPFQQFAFVVFGEEGNVAEQIINNKAELIIGGRPVLYTYYPLNRGAESGKKFENGEASKDDIESESDEDEAGDVSASKWSKSKHRPMSEEDILPTFNQTIKELSDAGETVKAASLESMSEEIKMLMLSMSKKARTGTFVAQAVNVLSEISTVFAAQTDEKLRKYVSVQDYIYMLCRRAISGGPLAKDSNDMQTTDEKLVKEESATHTA